MDGGPQWRGPHDVNGAEVYGAGYPTQIWHDVMAYALRDVAYSSFPVPDPNLMPPVVLDERDLASLAAYLQSLSEAR